MRNVRNGTPLGFDEAAFLGKIGLTKPVGERGYSALERLWARPTADINGIWGGYTGIGSKTVIASEASRKCPSAWCRTRIPAEVLEQFKRFVTDRLPAGATAEFEDFTRTPGIEVNIESPLGARRSVGAWRRIRQARRADGLRRLNPCRHFASNASSALTVC